jgi:hypothetical protein
MQKTIAARACHATISYTKHPEIRQQQAPPAIFYEPPQPTRRHAIEPRWALALVRMEAPGRG